MLEKLSEEAQNALEEPEDEKIVDELTEAEIVEKEAAAVKKVVVQAIKEEFSGPIPHPDIIREYERILPGSADRIISMAENQAKHRQEMERKMICSEARDGLLGIVFAFMLGLGCIAAAVIMVYLVPKSAGAVAGALLGVTGMDQLQVVLLEALDARKRLKKTRKNNGNRHPSGCFSCAENS